jgi:2-polyprenyl-3-methyl-5-hydroxy-6-metoxy-1,4-benzoquinol methylase
MDHEEAGRLWNGNAEAWTKLARDGFDVYRDQLNTPAFFALLPDVAGLDIGCCEGHNIRLLARRGTRVTVIDIAGVYSAHARQAEADEPLGIEYRFPACPGEEADLRG